jgi:hypothetical protein
MRLLELNPRWTGYGSNENPEAHIINGVTFDCPHCRKQRLGVLFHPAIDRGGWLAKGVTIFHGALEWTRTGDTFDTLTLSPSINANSRIEFQNHWHGFIENGEVK